MYSDDELDEELNIDFKKINLALLSRKRIMILTFVLTLCIFIALTYILPKKYVVDTTLYINKANSSNFSDINPYAIAESMGNLSATFGTNSVILNEIEIIKSPAVIDYVIRDNDIRYKKLFNIITTKKTGQYVDATKFVKKLKIENIKGTNVINISYKSKKKELAYGIISRVIDYYQILYNELNAQRAESDIKILTDAYENQKQLLDNQLKTSKGTLPTTSYNGTSGINILSAYNNTANSAFGRISNQYIDSQKNELEIREEASKLSNIAVKLQYAKLIESMSAHASKIVILKSPKLPKDYEQASPKLFMNIILGIIFGSIFALFAAVISEMKSKTIDYSLLGNNIIYNDDMNKRLFSNLLLKNLDKNILIIKFAESPILDICSEYKNIKTIASEINLELTKSIEKADEIILVVKLFETATEDYKQVKDFINHYDKKIISEVLV